MGGEWSALLLKFFKGSLAGRFLPHLKQVQGLGPLFGLSHSFEKRVGGANRALA